jgi:hypothetical protein
MSQRIAIPAFFWSSVTHGLLAPSSKQLAIVADNAALNVTVL